MFLRCVSVRNGRLLTGNDFGIPPVIPQTVAVPAHA
jgi:hypothetical protein